MRRLLIGDGDEGVRGSLECALSPLVSHVVLAEDAESALAELLDPRIEVAILDPFSVGFSGVSFMEAMRSAGCRADVIVVTEQVTVQHAVAALRSGVCEFLGKPLDAATVVRAVEGLIRLRPNPRYWAERLRRFVTENCAEPSLSLRSVSRQFGISTSYTSRLFRDEIGTTFRKHLARCRIQKPNDNWRSAISPCTWSLRGAVSEASAASPKPSAASREFPPEHTGFSS